MAMQLTTFNNEIKMRYKTNKYLAIYTTFSASYVGSVNFQVRQYVTVHPLPGKTPL